MIYRFEMLVDTLNVDLFLPSVSSGYVIEGRPWQLYLTGLSHCRKHSYRVVFSHIATAVPSHPQSIRVLKCSSGVLCEMYCPRSYLTYAAKKNKQQQQQQKTNNNKHTQKQKPKKYLSVIPSNDVSYQRSNLLMVTPYIPKPNAL